MTQPHDAVQDDAVQDDVVQGEALPAGGTTPVPNDLLDRVMPTLRDTELRVLLVVVRQTLGWQARPGSTQRKERDWLTQSQFMRRTGRASGAVSRAVDALVRAGLVRVVDRSGTPVRTPAERRRHLGHLYYQLGTGFGDAPETPKSEHAKSRTTKETQTQKYKAFKQIVDKPRKNPLDRQPFVVRTKGWQRVTRPDEASPKTSSTTASGAGSKERPG